MDIGCSMIAETHLNKPSNIKVGAPHRIMIPAALALKPIGHGAMAGSAPTSRSEKRLGTGRGLICEAIIGYCMLLYIYTWIMNLALSVTDHLSS